MPLFTDIANKFNVTSFRDGQEDVMNATMMGKDVLCFMPTGYGKSLCYQIPACLSKGVTLVISPLIALMDDQVKSLHNKGISSVAIHTEMDVKKAKEALSKYDLKLMFVSPERLTSEPFIEYISSRKVSRVVIDEAHCISSWGSGFRPEYKMIGQCIRRIRSLSEQVIPVSAFTATANHRVIQDIINYSALDRKNLYCYKGDVLRNNIYLSTRSSESKNKDLIRLLASSKNESTVIYCSTIREVEKVSRMIGSEGISHVVYHGKLAPENKRSSLNSFMNDEVDICVATSAFGMGVDKQNIRNVIHFQLPESIEMYYQQVGRAGRDGAPAKGVTLYSKKDRALSRFMTQLSFPKYESVWSISIALGAVSIDGMVEISVSDLLLISPISLSEHEFHGVFRLLKSQGVIVDFSEIESDLLRLEYYPENLHVEQDLLDGARKRAKEDFDSLFSFMESTLCRSFLIQDYFSSKKITYNQCGRCDNCVEQHKRIDLNKDVISFDEIRLIERDLRKIGVIGRKELTMHWIGHRTAFPQIESFGLFSVNGYQFVNKVITRFIQNGLLIPLDGKLLVCKEAFKKALKNKVGIVLNDNDKLTKLDENKILSDRLYNAIKNKRDSIAELRQLSPNSVLNELQIRKIASSEGLTREQFKSVVGEDNMSLFYDEYVAYS